MKDSGPTVLLRTTLRLTGLWAPADGLVLPVTLTFENLEGQDKVSSEVSAFQREEAEFRNIQDVLKFLYVMIKRQNVNRSWWAFSNAT